RDGAPLEYRLDTPAASIATSSAGEYRVTVVDATSTELAVSRGIASITTPEGTATLLAGQRAIARAGDRPGPIERFNAAAWDDFERWSHERRCGGIGADAGHPLSTPPSAALPPPLVPYAATLAHYGTWSYDRTHGHVWAPRVSHGWRPFYNGRWASLAPYGWIWIGHDPWAWPTHYYGSWSVTPAGVWFWIPGRVFRPAAVQWIVTTAYVGWVPWGVTHAAHLALTLVPRHIFAVNVFVPRHSVRVRTFHADPWISASGPPPLPAPPASRAFAVERRSIVAIPRAVPRDRLPAADGRRPPAQRIGADRAAGSVAPDRMAVRRGAPAHPGADGLATIVVPRVHERLNVPRAPSRAAPRERVRWPTGTASIPRFPDVPTGFSLPPAAVPRAGRARAPEPSGVAGSVLGAPAQGRSPAAGAPPRVVQRWPGPVSSGVTSTAPAPAAPHLSGAPQRYAVPRSEATHSD
ncbi:MAG TPA: DUF6600 domain-containing protein, partial [Vicinamibacterales bacterium]|nr:DUF6600 domain-containing protein [Vicinamibacterales bacterium]